MYKKEVLTPDENVRDGSQAFLFLDAPLKLTDIIGGTNLYYPGSTIQIEEVASFEVSINNPTLIDVDLRYWSNHSYMGSYQIIGIQPESGAATVNWDGTAENEGKIYAAATSIKRYSEFTVIADPAKTSAWTMAVNLSDCNFSLRSIETVTPNFAVGDFVLNQADNVLKGKAATMPFPLLDRQFFQKIQGLGFYIYPGAQLESVSYQVSIINGVSLDAPIAAIPACTLPPKRDTCESDFVDFLSLQPTYYTDLNQVVAIVTASNNTLDYKAAVWTCPSNPRKEYKYWIISEKTDPLGDCMKEFDAWAAQKDVTSPLVLLDGSRDRNIYSSPLPLGAQASLGIEISNAAINSPPGAKRIEIGRYDPGTYICTKHPSITIPYFQRVPAIYIY